VYDGAVQTQKQICGNLFYSWNRNGFEQRRGLGSSYGGMGETGEWNLWGRLY